MGFLNLVLIFKYVRLLYLRLQAPEDNFASLASLPHTLSSASRQTRPESLDQAAANEFRQACSSHELCRSSNINE